MPRWTTRKGRFHEGVTLGVMCTIDSGVVTISMTVAMSTQNPAVIEFKSLFLSMAALQTIYNAEDAYNGANIECNGDSVYSECVVRFHRNSRDNPTLRIDHNEHSSFWVEIDEFPIGQEVS